MGMAQVKSAKQMVKANSEPAWHSLMKKWYPQYNPQTHEMDLATIFRRTDHNRDGGLDIDEFIDMLELMKPQHIQQQEKQRAQGLLKQVKLGGGSVERMADQAARKK